MPDCYYRVGKNIFLIEFKDVVMPANIISNGSYEQIKQEVERKFVQTTNSDKRDAKGIGQILKQLDSLNKSPFQFDDFTKKGLKVRNLVIYPVIVYTDPMFGMPGINSYLSSIFNDKLKQCKDLRFKKVNNVCLIHFKYFYQHLNNFQSGNLKLKENIDYYLNTITVRAKKHDQYRGVDNLFKLHENFEEVTKSKSDNAQRNKFVKALFESLNLLKSFKIK